MAAETEVERLVVRLMGDGSSYQRMLRQAEQSTKQATGVIGRAAAKLEGVQRRLNAVGAGMRNVGRRMRGAGLAMTAAITLPLAGIGFAATRAFGQFDRAMIESTSIMQVTADQTQRMRQQALSLSGSTVQAPEELARSYFFLASAGKDAEQSMALLPPLTKFATAGAFDMALATDLLTDAQSALGLSTKNVAKDTANMIRLSDALVKANTLSNATVQQFSESLTNTAGASLKAFNKDLEEGLAVLGAYADQGVKGAIAGTSLSRVMLLLSKASRDNAKEHEQLGFNVFDTSGKMRNFADIIQNLEQITAGMSDEAKAAALEQLGFQARIQQAILPLLGTSDAIRRYEHELRRAAGTTEQVANKQMRAFSNQLRVLRNRLTTVAIEIGQTLAPVVLRINDLLQRSIEWWRGLSDGVKRAIVFVGVAVATLGPLLLILGTLVIFGGAALSGIASFIGLIGTAAASVTGILAGLLSPIGAIIAAVVGIGAVTVTQLGGLGAVLDFLKSAASTALSVLASLFSTVTSAGATAFGAISAAVGGFIEFASPVFLQFWSLVKTIFGAMASLVQTVFGVIASIVSTVFGKIKEVATSVWNAIGDDVKRIMVSIRDAIVDALLFAEFTFKNFGQVAEALWVSLQLGAVRFVNQVVHFFTEVLPALFDWFINNWREVFVTAFNFATTVFSNLASNIAKIFSNIGAIIRGEISISDLWTPLTEGFENAISELPDIPEREIGGLEKQLAKESDRLNTELAKDFQDFRDKRLKDVQAQLAKEPDQVIGELPEVVAEGIDVAGKEAQAVATKVGADLGKSLGTSMQNNLRFDAALSGSAEALTRMAEFRDMLLPGVTAAVPKVPASPTTPGSTTAQVQGQPLQDRELPRRDNEELRKISAGVQKLVNLGEQQLDKDPIEVESAGLN